MTITLYLIIILPHQNIAYVWSNNLQILWQDMCVLLTNEIISNCCTFEKAIFVMTLNSTPCLIVSCCFACSIWHSLTNKQAASETFLNLLNILCVYFSSSELKKGLFWINNFQKQFMLVLNSFVTLSITPIHSSMPSQLRCLSKIRKKDAWTIIYLCYNGAFLNTP